MFFSVEDCFFIGDVLSFLAGDNLRFLAMNLGDELTTSMAVDEVVVPIKSSVDSLLSVRGSFVRNISGSFSSIEIF